MFVRNAWYVAATQNEVADQLLARTILNEPIVLFKNGQGEICALEDRCHRSLKKTRSRWSRRTLRRPRSMIAA